MELLKIAKIASACLALTLSGPALAGGQILLKPAGQWNINYADESCQLARKFGVGSQETILQFEKFGPTEEFSLIISSRLLKFQENNRAMPSTVLHPTTKDYLKTTFQFLPNGKASKVSGIPALDKVSGIPTLINFMVLSGASSVVEGSAKKSSDSRPKESMEDSASKKLAQMALERSTNALLVDQPFNDPIMFELGSLAPPFAALAACTEDLMKSWGLQADPEHWAVTQAEPIGDPIDWFEEYATLASKLWKDKENSIIYFRLIVNERGEPEKCVVQDSTETQEFRDFSCKVMMEKARFKPATNAAGQPVKSVFRNFVRYVTLRNPRRL